MADQPFRADSDVRDRLPPPAQWPQILPLDGVPQTGPLNCVTALLDRHLAAGAGHRPAIQSDDRRWTYEQLNAHVSRFAHLMADVFAIAPGNRVLIRGGNGPEVAALWLAIQKIGAVAVTTMPLLRAGELRTIMEIARPALAFCEDGLAAELDDANRAAPTPCAVVRYGAQCGDLYARAAAMNAGHATYETQADDVSLIAFTSGTTGRPKATVHFHRDVISICETLCRHVLQPVPGDVFIGTAPLAFTFGLGGLLAFPLYAGASTVLNVRYAPDDLLAAIGRYSATICFTVPTFFQQMLKYDAARDLPTLRLAVSSGEALPLPVRDGWRAATGRDLAEVLGSTEMLHAFAGSRGAALRRGFIGPALPGYVLAVLDENGAPLPAGEIGRLAVKGPTGCRYLDDARQGEYVQNGWNLTGDACSMSDDGYIAYHSRYDDMIVSAGYNIAGVEVENALLRHPDVSECAVVGEPDAERGQIVVAHVVAKRHCEDMASLAGDLQAFVRSIIAPYKYPRVIRFTDRLPRNESGKIQRFLLRGKCP